MAVRIGFAVIYRWRLKPGMEETFRLGWERVTLKLKQERGALGSRLHRAEDGSWVAYAQWPSKAAWETSQNMPSIDPEASKAMHEAIEDTSAPILLTPVLDHLLPGSDSSTSPPHC